MVEAVWQINIEEGVANIQENIAVLPQAQTDEIIGEGGQAQVFSTEGNPFCVAKMLNIKVKGSYVDLWPGKILENGDKIVTFSDLQTLRDGSDFSSTIINILKKEKDTKEDYTVDSKQRRKLTAFQEVIHHYLSTDESTKERIVPLQGIWFIKGNRMMNTI